MREISPLQKERLNYQPKLAGALANGINSVKLALGEATTAVADKEDIKRFISKYFGHIVEDSIDDIDGERMIKKWIIPDWKMKFNVLRVLGIKYWQNEHNWVYYS